MFSFLEKNDNSIEKVIAKVKKMTYNSNAKNLAYNVGLKIQNVSWEDNARNKNSSTGPCISDMTLQVGNDRMPVIRHPNFEDITWDVEMDKIPLIVGNEKGPGTKLNTISLREYLSNFTSYMSIPPKNGGKINLICSNSNSKIKDTHVVMSSQCCFLPIEKAKETSFNVALYNYQSRKDSPAVLVIVSTSKGTSAQIIQGNDQKLLFNNHGTKADFVGQRLTDNRKERNVSIHGEMTKEEKQDNCIIIIQVPLKQKKKNYKFDWSNQIFDSYMAPKKSMVFGYGVGCSNINQSIECKESFSFGKQKKKCNKKKRKSKNAIANVEAAIIKIQPKTIPLCKCGDELKLIQKNECYDKFSSGCVSCDECQKNIKSGLELVWHCSKGKFYKHSDGYDLCRSCGEKQLKFNEFNNIYDHEKNWKCERNEKYPIRVTLQYYKSTDNGVVNKYIMDAIKKLLDQSKKQADFIGSLVTNNTIRPTEPKLNKKIDEVIAFPIHLKNKYEGYQRIYDELQKIGGDNWYTYVENFIKEEVKDCDLSFLGNDELKELIPKMGPRTRFKKFIQEKI